MSITDAAQQCNRDFSHFRQLVHLVKETRQELCQGLLTAFPEERFVKVRNFLRITMLSLDDNFGWRLTYKIIPLNFYLRFLVDDQLVRTLGVQCTNKSSN